MTADKAVVAQFGYRRSPEQDRREPAHHAVIIVGAGPVGMSLALDLAGRGVTPLLLDDADRIGEGSRGICWAKRTLEIWDRLGVADRMVARGVEWQKGKVFLAEDQIYEFDLLPEGGHKMPAFINLQQYYVEQDLAEAVIARGLDLRWRNKVVGIEPREDGAIVAIETPDGPYRLSCDWLVCCDGARSPCRAMLGLGFVGEVMGDQFLIADVKMTAKFPTERWFWFDPPFHSGRSALLHKQPDDVWRIDLQLGLEADTAAERRPEAVRPRIERMLGHKDFELEWVSIYTFQCRRLERFRHGRVLFAGDAAHQVSPFGARGANSGVQDVENLAWKLAAVLGGRAGPTLIDSYDIERSQAADENIRHSTRATDFIAPRSPGELVLRHAALDLASRTGFAKRFVNAGRLSVASIYDSPLSTPDDEPFGGVARLGGPIPDAPVGVGGRETGWLLEHLKGDACKLLVFGEADLAPTGLETIVVGRGIRDREGLLTTRLDARPGSVYVIRPDQHLAARMRKMDVARVHRAVTRAMGGSERGAA